MKVLISTLWDGTRVPFVIQKKQPDKIYFLMDDNPTRKDSFSKMKKIFKDKDIQEIRIDIFDIFKITEKVGKKIKEELSNKNEVFVCISEAMKPMSLSVMYAAYLYSDAVEGIYYVMPETGEIIQYPLLDLSLKNGRKEVLKIIGKLSKTKKEIKRSDIVKEARTKIQKSAVYENLNELIRAGFVKKEDNTLTMFGEICLLN